MPSLAQLDQAVREFLIENPTDVVTVVVDASFGHRIDASELDLFEGAEEAGELVSPPAGAIGRGDAFLLRIADKTGATVLSNDSFQEFHGDYDWLFERGRLIGGKPVPGVGWIFTPRTPVRGPRSREAVQEAKRKKRGEPEASTPGLDLAAERTRGKGKGKGKKNVERAIAVALEEAVAPKDKPRRRRSGGSPPAEPVNDPLAFITFIAAHPLGTEVTASVESFASHGAFVEVEGARCYVPLSAMGDPPPKSAREVFAKGESVTFVIQALDPQRRGVELALPRFAKVAGAPTAETVEAEIGSRSEEEVPHPEVPAPAPTKRSRKKAAAPVPEVAQEPVPTVAAKKVRGRRAATTAPDVSTEVGGEAPRPAKGAAATRAPAATATAGEKAPARKRAPARKAASVASEPPAPRKRTAKKAAAAPVAEQVTVDAGVETPEVVASRTRSASRKARSAASPDGDADVAFRTAGRKRAPDSAPPPSGRGDGRRKRTAAPAEVPVAVTAPAPVVQAAPAKRASRTRKSPVPVEAESPPPAGTAPAKKTRRGRTGRTATTDGAQTPN